MVMMMMLMMLSLTIMLNVEFDDVSIKFDDNSAKYDGDTELQNVNLLTHSKSFRPNFTQRKCVHRKKSSA